MIFDSVKKSTLLMALPVMVFCAVMAPSNAALAQTCETTSDADSDYSQLGSDIVDDLKDFMTQEENFVTELVTHRAKYEMLNRLYEFDYNIRVGLTNWWWNSSGDCFLCALKHMTMQLSADQVDQSRMLGSLIDAQLQNEFTTEIREQEVEAQRRYQPNEASCTVDSVASNPVCLNPASGCGGTKAQKMARALTRAMTEESEPVRANAVGSPSERGMAGETTWLWDEYIAKWCDPRDRRPGRRLPCPRPRPRTSTPTSRTSCGATSRRLTWGSPRRARS